MADLTHINNGQDGDEIRAEINKSFDKVNTLVDNNSPSDITFEELNGKVNEIITKDSSIVRSLEPVDFFDLRTITTYDGYGYGVAEGSNNQIIKLNLTTGVQENWGTPFPEGNIQTIQFMKDGICFVEGETGDLIQKLHRTTDNAQTWDLVHTQDIENVWGARHRGICDATINGDRILYYAEYNVNNSRVNGSTNDRIRVLRSDDLGFNWYTVVEFNTDGSNNNIRHFHGIIQNPYNNRLYLLGGDTNSQSVIYSWDGVTDFPYNVNPVDTVQTESLISVAGEQRYRVNDIIFDDGKCYWISDAETSVNHNARHCGVFSCNYDLTDVKQISTAGTSISGLAGRLGELLSTGEIVWSVNNESAVDGSRFSVIVVSSKDKTVWKEVGAYCGSAANSYYFRQGFFAVDDILYMCASYGAGKSLNTTAAFKLSENEFRGDTTLKYRHEIIHPCYWVDPVNGDDSNDGWSPRTPKKNIDVMCQDSTMTYGSRLVLQEGNYEIDGFSPLVATNAIAGDPDGLLVIQGSGASRTTITLKSDSFSASMFVIQGLSNRRLDVCDVTLKTDKSLSTVFTSDYANSKDGHIGRLTRCLVSSDSSSGTWSFMFISNYTKFEIYDSVIEASGKTTTSNFYTKSGSNSGNMDIHIENSWVFDGVKMITTEGLANNIKALNCNFINPRDQVIRLDSLSEISDIYFDNCGFWTSYDVDAEIITNNSGGSITFTGVEFDGSYGNLKHGDSTAFTRNSRVTTGNYPVLNYTDLLY